MIQIIIHTIFWNIIQGNQKMDTKINIKSTPLLLIMIDILFLHVKRIKC